MSQPVNTMPSMMANTPNRVTTQSQAQPAQPVQQPQPVSAQRPRGLVSKNVRIHGRRTSVRLEPEMWAALLEVAGIEKCSIHDICSAVSDEKEDGQSFTAALRVYLVEFYRSAAKTSHTVGQVQRRLQQARLRRESGNGKNIAATGF